jgi:dienelactone hydrolase
LLTQWASAGYVVAAVNFPRTSCPAYTAKANEKDLVNQPGDVDSVIGYLDAASKAGQGLPAGLIDPSRVAVAGHSDGGDTVAAMAANPCCRNLGLRAVIVLSGAELPGVTGPWFTGAAPPPMLFVQGSADTINKPSFSEQLYQADTAGTRYYLNLLAGAFAPKSDEHLVPYEGSQPPEPIVSQVTIDFLDQYLQGSGNQTSAMQAVGNTGASQLTIDRPLP